MSVGAPLLLLTGAKFRTAVFVETAHLSTQWAQIAEEVLVEQELSCAVWGFLYVCCFKVRPCLRAWLRTELRRQGGIEGTQAQDCLISCFMADCALCQENAEWQLIKLQRATVNGGGGGGGVRASSHAVSTAVVVPQEPVSHRATALVATTPDTLQSGLLQQSI